MLGVAKPCWRPVIDRWLPSSRGALSSWALRWIIASSCSGRWGNLRQSRRLRTWPPARCGWRRGVDAFRDTTGARGFEKFSFWFGHGWSEKLARMREMVGPTQAGILWEEGARLTLNQAASLALKSGVDAAGHVAALTLADTRLRQPGNGDRQAGRQAAACSLGATARTAATSPMTSVAGASRAAARTASAMAPRGARTTRWPGRVA